MKVAIALLVILVSANSMSLMERFPINFTEKRSIMTLMTQIEEKMKMGGPLDAITNMLNEFVTTINEEQLNHDQLFAEQQAECADEFQFREQEVSAAVAALKEATETLDGCKAQKNRAEGDLELTKKQLSETRQYLAQVEDIRRQEAYWFETAVTAFDITVSACNSALDILDEIWAGEASFVQLSRHMNGLVKHAIKVKAATHMQGLMAAMVQLSNKEVQADDELLNRVKSMIENFRDKVQDTWNEVVAAEEAAIAAYNEEKARLTATIESLVAQQAGLEAEIAELNKCIVVQSGIVTAATIKRDRNQKLWDDAIALCEAVTDEYHVATSTRSEELELLAIIRERVEERFGQLSEGVKERGMQDEFEYEANYDYEQEEFVPSV